MFCIIGLYDCRGNKFSVDSRIEYPQFSDAYTTLAEAFGYNQNLFVNDYGRTVRRLRPIFSKTLERMIGSNKSPLNFQKMISEGWVVLCNLDPQVWDVPQQKFLGTLKKAHSKKMKAAWARRQAAGAKS
jgi:hypothetical protein